MNPQIAKWNARYADREPRRLDEPSRPLPRAVSGLAAGRALDLGCGTGRHAVWLAARGWRVDAVDGSSPAVALLLANAAQAGCRPQVAAHVADLEADPPAFQIKPATYDLIVDCYFLHRPLFEPIREGVRPGGLFVAALHLPAADDSRGHAFMLRPGELEGVVTTWGWDIRHSVERPPPAGARDALGVAEIIARRPDIQPVDRR